MNNGITLTGPNGFVGCRLLEVLRNRGLRIQTAGRNVAGEVGPDTAWQELISGYSTIIHLAARAHVMRDEAADPLAAYRRVNTAGTLNLARQAAALGVQRFVFLSSIGVNGRETRDRPFTTGDIVEPHSPYAQSKYEAELELRALASETGMEVVIIRSPLVYGPRAPGNFGELVRWLDRGLPLPLGAIRNRRSLVGLDNLIDLIIICLDHPAAANQTFLVSDDDDLSTTELLRRMAIALERSVRLLPVPPALLKWGANLLGKKDVAQRLLGNLQVDISKTKELLGWSPPVSVDEGLRKTAEWYLRQR